MTDVKIFENVVKVIFGKVEFYKTQLATNETTYTLSELNSILHRLRSDYDKFEENQTKIEILHIGEDGSQIHGQTRGKFELQYFEVESTVLKLIDLRNSSATVSKSSVKSNVDEKVSLVNPLFPLHPVSNIELPKFDGKFESWINFRLSFMELVHENKQLSPIVKFQYLRNSLKGGSADYFIDGLIASHEHYENVWKSLCGHYENDTRLKFYHMSELYNLQPIKANGNLGREIQMFIAEFWKHYNTLKSIDVPIEHWDLYLVYHVCQLADQESLKQIEI